MTKRLSLIALLVIAASAGGCAYNGVARYRAAPASAQYSQYYTTYAPTVGYSPAGPQQVQVPQQFAQQQPAIVYDQGSREGYTPEQPEEVVPQTVPQLIYVQPQTVIVQPTTAIEQPGYVPQDIYPVYGQPIYIAPPVIVGQGGFNRDRGGHPLDHSGDHAGERGGDHQGDHQAGHVIAPVTPVAPSISAVPPHVITPTPAPIIQAPAPRPAAPTFVQWQQIHPSAVPAPMMPVPQPVHIDPPKVIAPPVAAPAPAPAVGPQKDDRPAPTQVPQVGRKF